MDTSSNWFSCTLHSVLYLCCIVIMRMVHNETIFELESTQLKFGRNSLDELGWELSKYNSKKILLVADPVLQDFDVTQKNIRSN